VTVVALGTAVVKELTISVTRDVLTLAEEDGFEVEVVAGIVLMLAEEDSFEIGVLDEIEAGLVPGTEAGGVATGFVTVSIVAEVTV